MNLIAAVDEKWGIGYRNELLVHIPEDQKFFRTTTTGKVVVMGRKTLESFPGGKPLKNRVNIVLSTRPDYRPEGVTVCHGIVGLQKELQKYEDSDIYVIGGANVYEQLLPLCSVAYITKVAKTYQADAYFPNLDEMKEWRETTVSGETRTWEGIDYTFCTYERV